MKNLQWITGKMAWETSPDKSDFLKGTFVLVCNIQTGYQTVYRCAALYLASRWMQMPISMLQKEK